MADILKLFLEISVMASVMIGIVMMIRIAFAKKMSPAVMLLLWGMVLLRLCLPFTFASPVSLTDLLPEQTVAVETQEGTTTTVDQTTALMPAVESANSTGTNTQTVTQDTSQTAIETTTSDPADLTLSNLASDFFMNISILSMLSAIWITGMLVTLYLSIRKSHRFRKKLRFCNPVTDNGILELIRSYKKDTGVKKDISIVECDFVHAPAVFGYFKPRILIPSQFVNEMGRNNLSAILLHEIYHIRCHDILKNHIWLAAKALHWFNPLIWLAYKWFQDDVEVRRDQNTACTLNKDGALVYSQSLVEAARFSQRTFGVPPLATTLFESKCKLRQRINRLVKPQRKTKSAAAVSVLLVLVMIVSCFTTACQPTPEEDVVVQRDELEEKIEEPATSATSYNVSEHWTDTEERGNLTINIDADVTLPDVDKYPVTILEPVTLSQERIDEMVNYFVGDSKLFCYPSVFTKADYEEMLIEARRGQLVDGEYVVTEGTERYAEELEEKVANAPEDSPRVYTDTTLTYQTDLDGNVNYDAGPNFVGVGVECEDGNEATISAQNFTKGYGNSTSFSFWRISGATKESFYQECLDYGDESESGFDGYGEILDNIDLDIDDARAQAEKVISDFGITDLALVNEEKAVLGSMGNQYGVVNDLPDRGGYVFEYVRASGGIAGYQLMSFGSNGYEQEADYSPPFFQEMLTICVSEDGIEGFSWSGMAQVVETVSENVTLLPFEDIQQALIDQIYYENATRLEQFNSSESAEVLGEMAMTINVLSAELRVGYVSVKDNTQQAMLVPMWVFETSEADSYGDEAGEPYESKTYQFNAIDGGVIMPSVGTVAAEEDAILEGEDG